MRYWVYQDNEIQGPLTREDVIKLGSGALVCPEPASGHEEDDWRPIEAWPTSEQAPFPGEDPPDPVLQAAVGALDPAPGTEDWAGPAPDWEDLRLNARIKARESFRQRSQGLESAIFESLKRQLREQEEERQILELRLKASQEARAAMLETASRASALFVPLVQPLPPQQPPPLPAFEPAAPASLPERSQSAAPPLPEPPSAPELQAPPVFLPPPPPAAEEPPAPPTPAETAPAPFTVKSWPKPEPASPAGPSPGQLSPKSWPKAGSGGAKPGSNDAKTIGKFGPAKSFPKAGAPAAPAASEVDAVSPPPAPAPIPQAALQPAHPPEPMPASPPPPPSAAPAKESQAPWATAPWSSGTLPPSISQPTTGKAIPRPEPLAAQTSMDLATGEIISQLAQEKSKQTTAQAKSKRRISAKAVAGAVVGAALAGGAALFFGGSKKEPAAQRAPALEEVHQPPAALRTAPAPEPSSSQLPGGATDPIPTAIELVKNHPLGAGRGSIGQWLQYSFAANPGAQESWNAGSVGEAKYLVEYRVKTQEPGGAWREPISYLFEADIEAKTIAGKNPQARQLLAGGAAPAAAKPAKVRSSKAAKPSPTSGREGSGIPEVPGSDFSSPEGESRNADEIQ